MKQNNILKKRVKRAKNGEKHAIPLAGVSAFAAFLPIFRRMEATYLFVRLSSMLLVLLAHYGALTPTRACLLYYGGKSASNWRSTQYALVRLRNNGLANNEGGRWRITEKGMRELGLID